MLKTNYTHSPWSGKAYKGRPTADSLTKESQSILQRHPSISKAIRADAMSDFIAKYKAQHEAAWTETSNNNENGR